LRPHPPMDFGNANFFQEAGTSPFFFWSPD